jgi:hypothetical protein
MHAACVEPRYPQPMVVVLIVPWGILTRTP